MIRNPKGLLAIACAAGVAGIVLFNSGSENGSSPIVKDLPLNTANANEMPTNAPAPAAATTPALVKPLNSAADAVAAVSPAPSAAELQRPAVAEPVDTTKDDVAAVAAGEAARGVVRAVNEATLSAGMAAEIVQMPFSEGESFKKGDLLVEFNCARAQAESRAADAAMAVEQQTVDTNQELEKFNSIGKFDLLISVSKLNKAKAEAEALQAQIKECKIFAPFAGRVTERMTNRYESVTVSAPLMKIVDTNALELDLIVPSKWLQWLKPGSKFAFKVDETGQSWDATVDRLLPAVDPVSKTVKIIGRFAGKSTGKTIPGMSGTASFPNAG